MRMQTPFPAGSDMVQQLKAMAAEMRKSYLLTDEDFFWRTDWDPKISLSGITGGGTVVMDGLTIQEAKYLHVGYAVWWKIDALCQIVVGGGTTGARTYSFNPPPPPYRNIDKLLASQVGMGKIRTCSHPYLTTPQTGGMVGRVEITLNSPNFNISTPPGVYIYTAPAGSGGFYAQGFYETDRLPVRAK